MSEIEINDEKEVVSNVHGTVELGDEAEDRKIT